MSQGVINLSRDAEVGPRGALYQALAQVRRRLCGLSVASAACWAAIGFVLVVVTGMWIDLLWECSTATRIAVWILAAAAALVLFASRMLAMVQHAQAQALARRIDQAGRTGGEVLAGLELDHGRPEWSPLTAGMAQLAVGRAARLAGQVTAKEAVSGQQTRRAGSVLLALVFGMGLMAVVFPRMAATQWSRFTRPLADVPPFSPIQFSLQPGDVQVRYGSSLEISSTVSGAPVDRLELVMNFAQHQDVLPMFSDSQGRWRAVISKVLEPAEYFVRTAHARSLRYTIDVITVPIIEQVRVRVMAPAYTNRPAYEGPIPKDGISGLPGTQVQIFAHSNRPLSGGAIQTVMGDKKSTVEMQPTADRNEATGQFSIQDSGRFEVWVRDIAQTESLEPVAAALTLLRDERPLVRILRPQTRSLATPGANLPIELSAEDDYGLSRIALFRSLNDSRPLAQEVPLPAVAPTRLGTTVVLPLSEYELSPGDLLKFFARAEDNDPAGAKGSESQVVSVQIISQEDFEQMVRIRRGMQVLLSKYRAAHRRLESLQNKVEGLRKKKSPDDQSEAEATETLRKEIERLTREMKSDAEATRSAAKNLLPYDLDQMLTPQLEQLANELDEAAKQLDELAKAEGLSAEKLAETLDKLSTRLGADRQQFDAATSLPLDELERLFPLMVDEARFVTLVEEQSELADRMAAIKGAEAAGPATKIHMRELQDQQKLLREALDGLLQDIENHVARLPDEALYDSLRASALQFVEDVKNSDAQSQMEDAERSLADFNGERAAEKAHDAAETLRRFLHECNGMCDGVGNCLDLRFAPSLCNSMKLSIAQMLAEMGLSHGNGNCAGQWKRQWLQHPSEHDAKHRTVRANSRRLGSRKRRRHGRWTCHGCRRSSRLKSRPRSDPFNRRSEYQGRRYGRSVHSTALSQTRRSVFPTAVGGTR